MPCFKMFKLPERSTLKMLGGMAKAHLARDFDTF